MKKEDKIREEVEKTLSAFDNIGNLEDNPYLFTRIKAELKSSRVKGMATGWDILRPAILLVILIINAFTAIYIMSNNTMSAPSNHNYLSAISSEYSINHSYYSQIDKIIGN